MRNFGKQALATVLGWMGLSSPVADTKEKVIKESFDLSLLNIPTHERWKVKSPNTISQKKRRRRNRQSNKKRK